MLNKTFTVCDLPCEGYFSLKTTHFHCHCTQVAEKVGSHRDGQDIRRVGLQEVEGAHVVPSHDPSDRFRYLAAPGCVPFAARPASSSPRLPAESCHRNPPGPRSWRHHRIGDPAESPSDRPGCDCGALRGRCSHPLVFPCDRLGSSRDVCGHHSHCERCCSTHHPS